MNILRDFLEHMVDYAGLFPPARLDMKTAFHNYDAYRDSLESWMLGRFIVPFSRLAEMEEEAGDRIGAASEQNPFRYSLIAGPRPDAAALGLAAFNGKYRLSGNGAGAVVEAVECKADTIEEIRSLAGLFPEDVAVFVEIPWGKEAGGLIGALAEANLNAKVRTGGIVPDLYPPAAGLLNFIWACHLSGVPFKATAGLHHPVRSRHPITYEPGAPQEMMFGFLNVFLAAAFIREGMDRGEAGRLLEETDPSAFEFDEEGGGWRGNRLNGARLLEARKFAVSFGSCSFEEPLEDLKRLKWL